MRASQGGCYPRYSPSGHLVYGRNGSLLAVPFDQDRLEVTGQPFTVLEGVSTSCGAPGLTSSNYDVTPDGQRFLLIRDDDDLATASNTVVLVVGFAREMRGRTA